MKDRSTLNVRLTIALRNAMVQYCHAANSTESDFVRSAIKLALLKAIRGLDDTDSTEERQNFVLFIKAFEELYNENRPEDKHWSFDRSDYLPEEGDF